MINVTFGLAFLSGLLSFISPCVLPLVPGYVGYMSNRVTANAAASLAYTNSGVTSDARILPQRFQMALHGMAFVLGFTFVFVVFGLAITAGTRAVSGIFYTVQRDVIPRVGGALIILFGLHFLGIIAAFLRWLENLPFLEKKKNDGTFANLMGGTLKQGAGWLLSVLYSDTRPQHAMRQQHGLIGSGLMGIVFAAGWTPCIGPIYGTILTMAASSTGSIWQPGALLIAYSLGLGVPFFFTAVMLDSAQILLKRMKRYINAIKLFSGILMIVIGILVFTGEMQRISQIGASNALLSYRIEECTIQLFDSGMPISQLGDCLSRP